MKKPDFKTSYNLRSIRFQHIIRYLFGVFSLFTILISCQETIISENSKKNHELQQGIVNTSDFLKNAARINSINSINSFKDFLVLGRNEYDGYLKDKYGEGVESQIAIYNKTIYFLNIDQLRNRMKYPHNDLLPNMRSLDVDLTFDELANSLSDLSIGLKAISTSASFHSYIDGIN